MPEVILIIRHAEKPGPDAGIDETGSPDPDSLTPTGWQRAGAWAQLFIPAGGGAPLLPLPATLFASRPSARHDGDPSGSKSRRPLETLTPLARKAALTIDQRFAKGDEAALAAAASAAPGPTLICWQHESIPAIAAALAPGLPGLPPAWPGDRFNVVFRFDRPTTSAPWSFSQTSPILLAADTSSPI